MLLQPFPPGLAAEWVGVGSILLEMADMTSGSNAVIRVQALSKVVPLPGAPRSTSGTPDPDDKLFSLTTLPDNSYPCEAPSAHQGQKASLVFCLARVRWSINSQTQEAQR